jgi:hypothetical protein
MPSADGGDFKSTGTVKRIIGILFLYIAPILVTKRTEFRTWRKTVFVFSASFHSASRIKRVKGKNIMLFTQGTKSKLRRSAMLLTPIFFLLPTQSAVAQQSQPRVEIFGGASYLPANRMDFPRKNSGGFQTAVNANVNRWFGVAMDFGGQYSHGTSLYEYLVGPRFTKRTERVNVFVHALVGGAEAHTALRGFSERRFAFEGGGGFDVRLNDRIAIRPLQLDYIGSFLDVLENNLRVGSGVVIRLGGS